MMIKCYRERPLAVRAIQYDGTKECFERIKSWVESFNKNLNLGLTIKRHNPFIQLITEEKETIGIGTKGYYVVYDFRVFSIWSSDDFENKYKEEEE